MCTNTHSHTLFARTSALFLALQALRPPFHLLALWPLCTHMCMEWSTLSPRKTEIEFNKEAGDQACNMARHTDGQLVYMWPDPLLSVFAFSFLPSPPWSHSEPHTPAGSNPRRQSVRWSGEPPRLSPLVDLLAGPWADCSPALGLGQGAPCPWVRLLGFLQLTLFSAFYL